MIIVTVTLFYVNFFVFQDSVNSSIRTDKIIEFYIITGFV